MVMANVATVETKEKEMTEVATDEYQEGAIPPPLEMASEVASSNSIDQDNQQTKKPLALASVREVFSFGTGPKKILGLIFGMLFACVAGAIGPLLVFYFANIFQDLVADPTSDEFLAAIREVAYAFLVLGCVFCRTDECCLVVVKKSSHRGSLYFFSPFQFRCLGLFVGIQHLSGNSGRRHDDFSKGTMVPSPPTTRPGVL
jgi:hypothetical protein